MSANWRPHDHLPHRQPVGDRLSWRDGFGCPVIDCEGKGAQREVGGVGRPTDDIPYAEIYDRLLEAEDTLARVRSLLDPTVAVGTYGSAGNYRHEFPPTHIRARDLSAALESPLHGERRS